MTASVYSPLIHQAMEFAAAKHDSQWRKHPHKNIPYISHPASVAIWLTRAGYDEEVVAAGILHDVIEDCHVSSDELSTAFGERVAYLVRQVSEQDREVPWEDRKRAYRQVLELAKPEAVAIAAADHLHNIRSLIDGLEADSRMGRSFKVSMEQRFEHERACLDIVSRRLPGPLADELADAVADFAVFIAH